MENYADLFVALGKAVFHGFGKQFDEALLDLMDAGSALGVEETDDRLTCKLLNRSVMQVISSLIKNNKNSIPLSDETSFMENIKKLNYDRVIKVDYDFFNRPKECQFVKDIQVLLHEWLSLASTG